jgi:hypothetical protein
MNALGLSRIGKGNGRIYPLGFSGGEFFDFTGNLEVLIVYCCLISF